MLEQKNSDMLIEKIDKLNDDLKLLNSDLRKSFYNANKELTNIRDTIRKEEQNTRKHIVWGGVIAVVTIIFSMFFVISS